MRSFNAWLLALCTVTISSVSGQSLEAPPTTEESQIPPMRLALEEVRDAAPYATFNGGEITEGDMLFYHSRNSLYQIPQQWGPGPVADSLAEDLAWRKLAWEEMNEELNQLDDWDPGDLQSQLREVALIALLSQDVFPTVNPTEEDLRRTYDEHLRDYALPFQFWMRSLFLTCYEEHVVASGETPTSIATAIGGDPMLALDIRDTNHRRLLRQWEVSPEEIDSLSRSLVEGETLSVPISAEARELVRQRLEGLAEEIDTPEEFIEYARNYSESEESVRGEELGPLPRQDVPNFLPALLQAGMTLPLNTVSDIIETKHGFQIVMITRRQMNEYRSFDEVRDQVERTARQEMQTAAATRWMRDHIADAGGEILDNEAVVTMREVQGLDPETPMATLPNGDAITAGMLTDELRSLPGRQRDAWFPHPWELLLRRVMLNSDIIDGLIAQPGNEWIEQIVDFERVIRVTTGYEERVWIPEARNITEEMVTERYRSEFEDPGDLMIALPRLSGRFISERLSNLRSERIEQIMEDANFQITRPSDGETETEESED